MVPNNDGQIPQQVVDSSGVTNNSALTPNDDELLNYFLCSDAVLDSAEVMAQPEGFDIFTPPQVATTASAAMPPPPSNLPQTIAPVSALQNLKAQQLMRASSDDVVAAKTEKIISKSATTTTASTNEDDEKRQRRLARNRESARQSRRRKKQYLELLEEKVTALTNDIDSMRRKHLENADSELVAMKKDFIHQLKVKGDAQEITREDLTSLQERFGPNATERQFLMQYQFKQLEHLILPPYSKFLLWLSVQDDEFFTKDEKPIGDNDSSETSSTSHFVNQNDIWPLLIDELGLSFEQSQKIRALYVSESAAETRTQRRKLALAMSYMNRLRESMASHAKSIEDRTNLLYSVLSPSQTVTYLDWLENNADRVKEFCTVDRLMKSDSNNDSTSMMTMMNNNSNNTAADDPLISILKKPDSEITVEDVTELLAGISTTA